MDSGPYLVIGGYSSPVVSGCVYIFIPYRYEPERKGVWGGGISGEQSVNQNLTLLIDINNEPNLLNFQLKKCKCRLVVKWFV